MLDFKKPTHVVIVSVPYTDTNAPIITPALLKGVVNKVGIKCTAFDLNAEVHNLLNNHQQRRDLQDFFFFQQVRSNVCNDLLNIFNYMADRILENQPDMICLSLLHYQCQVATKWLSFILKKRRPDIPIVIGGILTGELMGHDGFANELKNLGLIDYYVKGDGELAFEALLQGYLDYPGINSDTWEPIKDLNALPMPNYDDYDFNLYRHPFIGIYGSRGCVQKCTFCDIHEYWKKYNWRTGDSIFNEMLEQNKKHGIQFFKFQDSLINGNVKEYNRLISLLAAHNRSNPDNRLHWSSYFIIRPKKHMSEEQWRLTADSGAYILSAGIECLVEKNRFHLGKKFTNEDLEFSIAMGKKYGIKFIFMTLVGYPTETHEDHQFTLQWIKDHAQYANDPIYRYSIGGGVAVLPNTWLERNQEQLGITWEDGNARANFGKNHLWKVIPINNTYETRMQRLSEIIDVAQANGFNVRRTIDPQKELEDLVQQQVLEYENRTH